VVVKAGAGFKTASALPVLDEKAAILFTRDQVFTNGLAGRILDCPLAQPEIKLTKLRRLTGFQRLQYLLKFRIAMKLLKFIGAGNQAAQDRSFAGGSNFLERVKRGICVAGRSL